MLVSGQARGAHTRGEVRNLGGPPALAGLPTLAKRQMGTVQAVIAYLLGSRFLRAREDATGISPFGAEAPRSADTPRRSQPPDSQISAGADCEAPGLRGQ